MKYLLIERRQTPGRNLSSDIVNDLIIMQERRSQISANNNR